ncbi:MAG: DUF4339 domain-containing protein [Bacteriovoracaceae bacterium]|mgnify:CR=1 FL=1|jgi:hypothetical protein|nr:DUF4339 domain-containing protein [Bacteriovoracaceae bacterium]
MEEVWFIFKGDHHLGPFSLEKVIAMYQAHELNENVLVWKEGNKPWTAFKDIPELEQALKEVLYQKDHGVESLPDLPPPHPSEVVENESDNEKLVPSAKDFKSEKQSDPFHYLNEFIGDAKKITIKELDDDYDDPPDLPCLPNIEPLENYIEKDFLQSRELIDRAGSERYSTEEAKQDKDDLEFLDLPDIPYIGSPLRESDVVEKGPPIFKISGAQEQELEISNEDSNIPTFSDVEDEEFDEYTDIEALEHFQSTRFRQKERIVQFTMGLLCFFMVMLNLYMFYDSKPTKELFFGLNTKNFNRLNKYVKRANTGSMNNLMFEWSADKDADLLWMAFNRKGPAGLHLSLRSLPGKILSTGDQNVVVTSQSKLYKGAALFNKFDIIKGGKFVYGHYDLTLQVFDTSLSHKFFSFLKALPIFKTLSFIQNIPGLKEIKSKILFFNGTKSMFNKKLSVIKDKRRSRLLLPLKYQLQSLTTMDTLLHKLVAAYSSTQPKWRMSKDINVFYNIYTREISPILQEIIIDFIRKDKRLATSQKNLSSIYEEIINYGKSISGLAAEMISKSKPKGKFAKKLDPKRQLILKEKFLKQSDVIKANGTILINNLSKKIKEM